jgi:ribonuclease T1
MNLSRIKNLCVVRTLSLLMSVLAGGMVFFAMPASADNPSFFNQTAVQEVALSTLPVEAKETLRLIKQGGPFPYARDGIVFGNYEKRLPKRQRGYYHEYTVKTPGVRSRGARRIVCGQSAECYYTADHYETFKRIRE